MKWIITGAIILCLALIGIGAYVALKPQDSGPRTVPLSDAYKQRVLDGGWTRGATKPEVTVIEYGDLQCPACKAYYPIVEQAFAQTKDIAQFEFRNYPLVTLHNKAMQAARAAEAAGKQGKFWEFESNLYETQDSWENQTPSQFTKTLEQFAKDQNLDINQYKKDIKAKDTQAQIDADMAAGNKVFGDGGASTPTFVINGTRLTTNPTSVDDFVSLIKQAATANATK